MSEFETHVTPDGVPRALNLVESPATFKANFGAGRVIPASSIRDFQSWPAKLTIKDQGSFGACVGHATATTIEANRSASGKTYIPLSAWFPYAILCNGWDRGASISEALTVAVRDGVAPESTVPWGTINPAKLSADSRKQAKRFTIEFGDSLDGWEQVLTAVALGQFVNLSVRAGNNFSNLDSEGVPGLTRGAANHAVTVGGGIKTSRKHGQLVLMTNSWGKAWGQAGQCWLSRAHIDNAGWFEAYTVVASHDDPLDPTNPPRVA